MLKLEQCSWVMIQNLKCDWPHCGHWIMDQSEVTLSMGQISMPLHDWLWKYYDSSQRRGINSSPTDYSLFSFMNSASSKAFSLWIPHWKYFPIQATSLTFLGKLQCMLNKCAESCLPQRTIPSFSYRDSSAYEYVAAPNNGSQNTAKMSLPCCFHDVSNQIWHFLSRSWLNVSVETCVGGHGVSEIGIWPRQSVSSDQSLQNCMPNEASNP